MKWTKMQNKPTKMELGLIELTKESALAFGKTFEELFNTGRYKEMGAYYSEDAELNGIKLPVYKVIMPNYLHVLIDFPASG